MTIVCPAPDESLGVALRLSGYLDCQARALGENGFEVFTGGPIVSGLLSGAVTIFVALIGYRFLLGSLPTLRDGFGWAMRLGLVLALTTGWPAFRTLVFDVATQAPVDLATTLLPAIGLPATDPAPRIEDAYEAIGHGITVGDEGQPQPAANVTPGAIALPTVQPPTVGFPASPITASLLVLSGIGIVAALRLAAGFLVAIGPIAVIGLLFDATTGLLASWIRALVGAALAGLGATLASMLEVGMVESEMARLREVQAGLLPSTASDPAAFLTIVAVFGLVTLVIVYASFRAAGGLRLDFAATRHAAPSAGRTSGSSSWQAFRTQVTPSSDRPIARTESGRSRADGVSDALTLAVQRDAAMRGATMTVVQRQNRTGESSAGSRAGLSLGQSGRRTSARRTRSATRRDQTA